MAREIPEVVRAAAGLAATVLDEARKLPETLPGLPVRVIGLAMQQAMRVQQHYAGLVARGDELFTGLRGENEPGLATFDDEVEGSGNGAAPTGGFRESAFDRADVPLTEVHLDEDPSADRTDLGDSDLPAVDLSEIDATTPVVEEPARPKAAKRAKSTRAGSGKVEKAGPTKAGARKAARKAATPAADTTPAADAVPAADAAPVTTATEQVEEAQQTLDALPAEVPSTEEVLEELAIDEMVGDTTAGGSADVTSSEPAASDVPADMTTIADMTTTADVLTPDGEVAAVEATVTDEGVAAPEAPAPGTTHPELPGADTPQVAPVDGYDSFSVAQLRGRLRGYALSTVSDLLDYEQATTNREPYLRMLRNRLEKLEEQAVASSPLAPRGA